MRGTSSQPTLPASESATTHSSQPAPAGLRGAGPSVAITTPIGTLSPAGALLACAAAGNQGNSTLTATTAPVEGPQFPGCESTAFVGTETDAEDGMLTGSQCNRWVDVHSTRTHHLLAPTTYAASGEFLVPPNGQTEDHMFLQVHSTAGPDCSPRALGQVGSGWGVHGMSRK